MLIINCAMVIIGIIGLLYYFAVSNKKPTKHEAQKIEQVQVETVNISVAAAKTDLKKGTRLTSEDYEIRTIKVPKDGEEVRTLKVEDVDNWMVKSDVAKDSYIPNTVLVEPGSEEYIQMSVKPGSIVYGFSIKQSDSYLFTNTKAGGGLDIYLAYKLQRSDSGNDTPLNGSSNNLANRHFKLLMKDKKILAIHAFDNKKITLKNGAEVENPLKHEGYVLIELTPAEVYTLKGLEDANIYIFPTSKNILNSDDTSPVLVGNEGQWPIDNRNILFNPEPVEKKEAPKDDRIKEYRGANTSWSKGAAGN